MAMRVIIIIAIVLSVTQMHAQSQYIDFFQSFSTFLQPQTTRRTDVTKRPSIKQTNRRFQDTIFFETDDFLRQRQNGGIDPFTTTAKPKKTKTTRKPTTRHQTIERNYHENQINNYDTNFGNTQKPFFGVAQMIPNRPTVNPLLYRPGVKPAVVDENRPPITNRPVTNRPVPVHDGPVIEIGPDEDNMDEAEKRRFIDIAEQKCEEYKSLNRKKVVALPLASVHASPGVELQVNTCAPNTAPLIIGGKVVSIQEFPHMGLLGWKNIQNSGYTWKCGGSLVSDKYVLTAGHCTYHEKDYNVISGPPSAVQLGSSYLDGPDALVVSISSVIRHPKYKTRKSYYDVALIKLETTVKFSKTISPACLGVPPPTGNRVITTGWGRTEFGGDSSYELRGVSIPIWGMDECRAVWGTSRKMPEGPSTASQLCAGEKEGGKDTCQGDSGGPAQIQDGCTWRVVAVTSIGRSCGAKQTPALYAKIPRAFIAAEIFSDVTLNNNNNQGVNNRYNENNQGNNRYNENNNEGVNDRYNENNNQGSNNRYNDNNNQGNNGYNNRENNQNRDEVRRPGNHQTIGVIGNDWSNRDTISNIRPGNHQTIGSDWSNSNVGVVNRPGNHQSINRATNQQNSGNRRPDTVNHRNLYNQNSDEINRPGNHQTVDNNNRDVKYFATSHIMGNEEIRLGNHQTVDNNNRDVKYFATSHITGNEEIRLGNHQTVDNRKTPNYFVTSHTTGNIGVSRTGNHQSIGNRGTSGKYFVTSHASDRETIGLPGNHQRLNNRGESISDSQNSESNPEEVFAKESYGNQNNGHGDIHYNNEQQNNEENRSTQSKTTQSYPNYEYNDSTTESVAYNSYNNGYNNDYFNNRGFAVPNRPWWSR